MAARTSRPEERDQLTEWVDVIAFSEAMQARLLACEKGETIAVSGKVTERFYRRRTGETSSSRPKRASCATSTSTTPSRAGASRRSASVSTSKRGHAQDWGRALGTLDSEADAAQPGLLRHGLLRENADGPGSGPAEARNADATYGRRRSASRHCAPRTAAPEEWIEIPVPAIIDEPTFARAQELPHENKVHARRRTIEPSLAQGLVRCCKCGYAFSRISTRSTARRIHYYRCIGSDRWRHLAGPRCGTRPVRQDLLDEVVWTEVLRLLEEPALIQQEPPSVLSLQYAT